MMLQLIVASRVAAAAPHNTWKFHEILYDVVIVQGLRSYRSPYRPLHFHLHPCCITSVPYVTSGHPSLMIWPPPLQSP